MLGIGHPELIIVGVIAVILFGSRLPSVARSMGRSLTEFKKGMHGLQEEMNEVKSAAYTEPTDVIGYDDDQDLDDRSEPTTPAFQPPEPEQAAR